MALEMTRATSTQELHALRLILAFSGHVTGLAGVNMPHLVVELTTFIFYDCMMASGYTIVPLQVDSKISAGTVFYYPVC